MRALIALCAALWAVTGTAHAQTTTAQCVVTEILATSEKKGMDGKLERFKAKLSKPPFSSWDTFAQLGEQTVALEKAKAAPVKLETGAVSLLYKDKLLATGGKARLRLGIDLDGKDGKRVVSTVLVFDSGDSVLIAGEPHKGGTYILALSCTAQ
jgi:hypothetical protein